MAVAYLAKSCQVQYICSVSKLISGYILSACLFWSHSLVRLFLFGYCTGIQCPVWLCLIWLFCPGCVLSCCDLSLFVLPGCVL